MTTTGRDFGLQPVSWLSRDNVNNGNGDDETMTSPLPKGRMASANVKMQ